MSTEQPQHRIGDVGPGAIVLQGENLVVNLRSGDRARPLVPAPSEQAPADYVDRPEVTRRLLAYLLTEVGAPNARAIISVVHGLGGIGKTTVARWIVWRPEIEQRFCDGRIWVTIGGESDARDAIAVITDCVSQLDPTFKTKATLEAARSELAALLRDRAVLFVVDDVWPGKSADVAKALMVPSPRSRFLLTTRFPQLADDPDIRAEDFPLDEMSFDQAAELIARAFGRDLGAAERLDAERLCEIVGGHPLALELAAARIKEGRPWQALLDDLAAEIARLSALEETDGDLVTQRIGGETRKRGRSVRASLLLSVRNLNRPGQQLFARLGVVAEDAIVTPSMAATLWSEEEETARRHLRELRGLGLLSTKGDGYSVHDLMHDLARELLTAPEAAARAGDIPGFGLTSQCATEQFLERYRAKTSNDLWHTLPDDGYIHDHLVRHFEHAGWDSELESLLWEESADGHCGWYQARERLGQTAGFVGDVGRVWNYADRSYANAASKELRAQAIGLQLHCALIIASINSLSAGIPVEVLVGAVRCGVLAVPSALALARQHPGPRLRVTALLALENEMGRADQPSVLDGALAVARGIDDAASRAGALAEVAQRLPANEALAVARSIDDAASRARALAEVAQRLPANQALAVARGIDDAASRAGALAEVAQRLPEEQLPGALREALSAARGIDDAGLRARALAEVAKLLPAAQQPRVLGKGLAVARGAYNSWWRAPARGEVAQRLPTEQQPGVLNEALSTARSIDNAKSRAWALAEVAQRLPAEQQLGVLREALSTARSIDDAKWRAEALAEVAQRLPAEDQPKALGEALNVARRIDEEGARAIALTEVAPRLPVEAALAVARGIDNHNWRAAALAKIAPRLPAVEALAVARSIDISWRRAAALAEIAQRLPAVEQASVLGEALNVARRIEDEGSRAPALAKVAHWLPSEEQPRVLGEALLVAGAIDRAWWRVNVLAEVAKQLPAEQQLSVLREALSAARGIDVAPRRVEALAEIAQHLPAEQQPSVLREALSTARSIDSAMSRAVALALIAQRLPAEDQSSIIGEALNATRGIVDTDSRDRTLAEVAKGLPAREALAVARGIDHVWWRMKALAEVTKRLPAEEALPVARGIPPGLWRAEALSEVAGRLPAEKALAVARSIDDAGSRARALAEVARRLREEQQPNVLDEALNAARGIDDENSRALALADVAQRLRAEEQPSVLRRALTAALGIDDAWRRAGVLAEIARRLPAEEALVVARGIDNAHARARALADVAQRYGAGQKSEFSMRQWVETARALAMHERSDCVGDFATLLPFIQALAGEAAVRSLGRSIVAVGIWWP